MPADPRAVLNRSAPAPDATVRYGDQPEQLADLRRPAPYAGPPRPLVVVIHGGFWRAEYDRTHTGPLAADLAARGYPVAQLEYRRLGQPGGGWPGTFADVVAGVAALPGLFADALPEVGTAAGDDSRSPRGAGRAELEPSKPILLGHSAGGQLALYCAATVPDRVGGVLALAPVADLAEAYRLDLGDGAVAALLGGGPDDLAERYDAADPARQVPIKPRTVILHGALDHQVPLRIAHRYAAATRPVGGDVTLIELPDCEHFGLIDPRSTAWPQVMAALQSFY